MIKGIGASSGIAIGKAVILQAQKTAVVKREVENPFEEKERFERILEQVRIDMAQVLKAAGECMDSKSTEILEAHLFLLDDPGFTGEIVNKILTEKVNAEYAVNTVADQLMNLFRQSKNAYLSERSADIKDVAERISQALAGDGRNAANEITEEGILVTKDLAPSDLIRLNGGKVLGCVTAGGGKTSHAAIIANSLGIPLVAGVGEAISGILSGDLIVLDGTEGMVYLNPEKELLNAYKRKMTSEARHRQTLLQYQTAESVTGDGKKVELLANIGSEEEVDSLLKYGAEGIGLFRTEFMFLQGDQLPSENEQFHIYTNILKAMKDKPVTIRTLDIGGDKKSPNFPMEYEMNPFLGCRAIRLCFDRLDVFKTQLRAILRSSIYGDLRLMFPMISTLEEVLRVKLIVEECKSELSKLGIPFNENIKVGIMIETPAAAMISDFLAYEVDFFSIGTNDLIQYTVAADRTNEKVAYLYDCCNPAVLRLIKLVVDNAHRAGIPVGICGEMATNREVIPMLVGMELDELSMGAGNILGVRAAIRNLNYIESKQLAGKALRCGSAGEIRGLLT